MTEFSRLNSRIQKQSRIRLFKIFLYLLVGGIVIYMLKLRLLPSSQVKEPLATNNIVSSAKAPPPPPPPKVTYPKNSSSLSSVVQQSLEGTKGTYGIVIKNLKTGESFVQNEHRTFEPASIYKVWIMTIIFQKMQAGTIKMEDPAVAKIPELNEKYHIPPEEAEFTSGVMNFTVKSALEQMITISHNYAALVLTDKISLQEVEKFLQEVELTESKVGYEGQRPLTTPSDVAVLFEKLYQGKLADEASTQEMLALLKRSKNNDLIPKYLPKEVEVGHKIGRIDLFNHDAGIVFAPSGDYIIVVMSQTDSPDLAEERVAELSRSVYRYFVSNP